ncbi:hypothetical protein [Allokutzneria albata]|uniref:Uncharacterized protein n=1 Tax=Allokutzneria albata TaxID=211114 RepID=A0A1H0DTA6_ALLAB|nr:hypothetical protein [Allokutzneria albata]SDN73477.1 hypothetical protein SAMN04489726_7989 [Allokutzneria albata]
MPTPKTSASNQRMASDALTLTEEGSLTVDTAHGPVVELFAYPELYAQLAELIIDHDMAVPNWHGGAVMELRLRAAKPCAPSCRCAADDDAPPES